MVIMPEQDIPLPYQTPGNKHFGEHVLGTCSVTLIDADVVITAGHCFDYDQEALDSSVIFNYETDCAGNRLPGYSPKFYKVIKVVNHHFFNINKGPQDWAILKLEAAPSGVPVIQLRPDLPAIGEQIFGIHHPNGAVKKLSIPHPGFDTIVTSAPAAIQVPTNFHVSGGSSGSGLFDGAGRILGVLSYGSPCDGLASDLLRYFPVSSILQLLAPSPPNPVTRDVMIVFDRSGSMLQLDSTKRTKIDVARDAVSLFVQLVRSGVGNRIGLVSFSSTASVPVDFALTDVDTTSKLNLIGAAPFAGGKVGSLTPGGATSIGDGLQKAIAQLPAGSNPRAILLLTDGMENTSPFIKNNPGLDAALNGISINAIGFGTPSNLDGPLLSAFAANHGGMYTNAETGVTLMKFFSHAFGNIFETGILQDPEFDLPSDEDVALPQGFDVCHEDAITVVLGWDSIDGALAVNLTTPSGIIISSDSANVESANGRVWTFLRVPLPYNMDQAGRWNMTVFRPPPPLIPIIPRFLVQRASLPLHYFINVIPTGGPSLSKAVENRTYYTADVINPSVFFHSIDGTWIPDANVEVTLSRPNASVGNILSKSGLHTPGSQSGDILPSRQSTLGDLGVIILQIESTYVLRNDPLNSGGFFEETGIFGTPLNNTLTVKGEYLFHARASTQDSCLTTREVLWNIHIDVGVSSNSPITITITGTDSNGNSVGVIVVTPQDPYGNLLGPGQAGSVVFTGAPGTTITGPVVDNGNGSYTIPISVNPSSGSPPGIIIQQPGRPPVTISKPGFCPTCVPYPGQNQCDVTTGCSNTPFGTMCSCRPGYKASASDGDGSKHWRPQWPMQGHEHRVHVSPGTICDTLCDEWWAGPESCKEVAISAC